jgi:hypothetical protein
MKFKGAMTTALIAMAMLCGSSAMATVAVNWIWNQNANGGVMGSDNAPLADASVVELIWTADQAIGTLDLVAAGDVVLDTAASTFNAGGGFWSFGTSSYDATDVAYGMAEDAFVNGYVYQRVYDGLGFYANSEAIQINGPLLDQDDAGGGATGNPDTAAYFNTSGNYDPGISAGGWVAVPEPSTMALLACGAVMVGLRRLRRKS